MTTIIFALIAVWLVKAAFDGCIGIFQILAGLVCGLLGLALISLASLLEILERQWEAAFGE